MTRTNTQTDTDDIVIDLTTDERAILPDVLEAQAEYVGDEVPVEAHVLWSHAEAMRGSGTLFQPIEDEWAMTPHDAEVVTRALDRVIDDLDAHSGPAYADSDVRRGRMQILSATQKKLSRARSGD